ncbi:alpha/beta fold hydrolase [Allokutzneria sp. NRRL B-24872]|uniref:alpha/beta fold hydrolase n=1 Tax=Allokutzneria sp. NRRL B-24872 TaxID=1137961 RepID=UPI000A386F38|nr:alpha/beta fold hydrolase [Allokutzneria sp. NRRL B-24872]
MRTVRVNGIELCAETFGDPADRVILLIAGAATSMDWWAAEFCARLAAAGRFVIRYDHRDTGASTCDEPGRPSYTAQALTDDALGLLDAVGVARAHLAGMSSGGAIAQELAVRHPDRVASLTVMSTTFYAGGPDLPRAVPELSAKFAAAPAPPDWSDRAAVVEHLVADWAPYSGPAGATEAELRELAERVVDRSVSVASSGNHWQVIAEEEGPSEHRLGEISVPALVIHGTADPLFPFPHGRALAAALPGASLLPLREVGHEVPPPSTWDQVIPAILEVTGGEGPAR